MVIAMCRWSGGVGQVEQAADSIRSPMTALPRWNAFTFKHFRDLGERQTGAMQPADARRERFSVDQCQHALGFDAEP